MVLVSFVFVLIVGCIGSIAFLRWHPSTDEVVMLEAGKFDIIEDIHE